MDCLRESLGRSQAREFHTENKEGLDLTPQEFEATLGQFFIRRVTVHHENQSQKPAPVMAIQEIIEAVAKVCDTYADVFEGEDAGQWYKQTAERIRGVEL